MSDLRFDGDPAKAAANARKHGVSFNEAQTVFDDERALLLDDPDHSAIEDRLVLLGLSAMLRMVVVYTVIARVTRLSDSSLPAKPPALSGASIEERWQL